MDEGKPAKKPKTNDMLATTSYFKKTTKRFSKHAIKKQGSQKIVFDGRNSLNRYINGQRKMKIKALADLKCEARPRDRSTTKISKIEDQVRKHCLTKKKYMKNPGSVSISTTPTLFNKVSKGGFLGSFKTEMSEQSVKNEDSDTRNTSKDYDKCEIPKDEWEEMVSRGTSERNTKLDSSFMYADLDLNDKKESHNYETRVSEKMTTKVYKTFASNLQRIFSKPSKSYGCNCGPASDSSLKCCKKAESWLKYAFMGTSKQFSKKDQKVFNELIETDTKKESKNEASDDDRIALTGKYFSLITPYYSMY